MNNDSTNHKSALGTDAVRLSVARMLNLIITLVSTMLLSRFRTLDEYGTYSQITMSVSLAVSLFVIGLPNSINFFLARAGTAIEKRKFLRTYFSFSTILSVLCGLALLFFVPYLELYFHNDSLHLYAFALVILPLTRVILESNNCMLIVVNKTIRLMFFSVINSLALLLIIIIVYIFSLSFYYYMMLFVLVQLVSSLIVYLWAFQLTKTSGSDADEKIDFNFAFKNSIRLIKQMLKFSIPLGLGSIVSTLSLELDKLVIGNMLNTESLAIYSNAAKELPLTMVATSFTAVLLPRLSRMLKYNKYKEAVSLWGKTLMLSYSIMCFFATAVIVFAPQVMTFLYSDKYIVGVNVFRVYALVLILRSTYCGMLLNISGNTKKILFSTILSLALNMILNIILYNIIGFTGPAWATFICIILINGLQIKFSANIANIPFKDFFPWLRLLKITLLNAAIGLIVYIAISLIGLGISNIEIIEAIIIGIIWTLVYWLIMKKSMKNEWAEINNYPI